MIKNSHPLAGKTIHLLRTVHSIGILNDGRLISFGSPLQFGYDYILCERESDNYLMIYDYEGQLNHIINL